MTPEQVFTLVKFLDTLFNLGGKLLEAAIQKEPSLVTEPLPDLSAMDDARQTAIDKIGGPNEIKIKT